MARFRLLVVLVLAASAVALRASAASAAPKTTYKLKFTEDFKRRKLNTKIWRMIEPGNPDWKKNMAPSRTDLVVITNGVASLLGIKNDGKDPEDRREVLTVGIETRGLFAFRYGKIEARVKFEDQKGGWPAFWMLPEDATHPPDAPKGWPNAGEIDIFERLNSDDFVYQTVHTAWNGAGPAKGGKGGIKQGDWNVYGVEWTPEEIVWTVNGNRTHSYRKVNDDPLQYPWIHPCFVMIDMQLGGKWVGGVDTSTLPVAMHIDWVKFYEAYRGGKRISEFVDVGKLKKGEAKAAGKKTKAGAKKRGAGGKKNAKKGAH